jgi:carotenoid cleavage dioxygenase
MPRSGGNSDVRWFEVEPCYVYHQLNAFEDGSSVLVDVVRYPEAFNIDRPGGGQAFVLDPSTLDRWRMDLATGRVTETRVDDRPLEFPRVDERLVGRAHRYGYGVEMTRGQHGREVGFGSLLKHDLKRGTTELHNFGPGRMAAEGVFVPAGPKAAEDEGWILAFVYDPEPDRSDLVILNAADFAGEPVATIHLPWRVPPGFHGSWIADPSAG